MCVCTENKQTSYSRFSLFHTRKTKFCLVPKKAQERKIGYFLWNMWKNICICIYVFIYFEAVVMIGIITGGVVSISVFLFTFMCNMNIFLFSKNGMV
ncbi:LOW QUALITY PROTEIN: hypothetical protein TorRG33x02_133560 [Trema orientale]|uniref:Transmembrane protein n=1 Tax=Trema orientale TaxID=63057 RepID=A0A2P5EZJ5_TREOI|nr:LOW QUALITY PROTEIN: hypothetical protein TorRG33x02_133560 [Trema orientale]